MAVLGVDGWRGAWVGARLDGRSVELLDLRRMADVLAVPDVEVVGIDMPIGLSDNGVRACDVAARDRLRPFGAASSVFPTPVRAVLATDDYAEARALSRAAQLWTSAASFAKDESLERPRRELGAAGGETFRVDSDVLLRRFYCPSCGTTLDAETALPGEPFLVDRVSG